LIPAIEPVPAGTTRPFWSVMIPTYRTHPEMLRAAIESVLATGRNADATDTQIEVVNDGDSADVTDLAHEYRGRVSFTTNPANLGAPANFTECIRRATGTWVHILHADDAVKPDFYDAYRAVIDRHPECVAVGGQAIWIDEYDEWIGVSPRMQAHDGLLENAAATIAGRHPCNFATTVVARATFERIGGFESTLVHANDWEMWTRAATAGPVGWVAEPHAFYRRHGASDSAQVQQSSAYVTDIRRAIAMNAAHFTEPATREWVEDSANTVLSDYTIGIAAGHLAAGRNRAAVRDAFWGVRVRPNLSTIGRSSDTAVRALTASVRSRLHTRRAR
jgi:GT2 family glycosyltransferase